MRVVIQLMIAINQKDNYILIPITNKIQLKINLILDNHLRIPTAEIAKKSSAEEYYFDYSIT